MGFETCTSWVKIDIIIPTHLPRQSVFEGLKCIIYLIFCSWRWWDIFWRCIRWWYNIDIIMKCFWLGCDTLTLVTCFCQQYKLDLTQLRLAFDSIQHCHINYIWYAFDLITTHMWLSCDSLLTTLWHNYSDTIVACFWHHFGFILTQFWHIFTVMCQNPN